MERDKKSKVCIEDYDQKVRTTLAPLNTPEHTKIYSRTLGRNVEVGVGMHGRGLNSYGGLVPANPFVSQAQEGWAHMHPEKFGKQNLKNWDAETKGKTLPKRAKK